MTVLQPTADQIKAAFFGSGDSAEVLRERSAMVDAEVIGAWERWLEPAFGDDLVLLAVGGYGRRELFPHSDVDLLLLTEKTPEGERKEAIAQFLRHLWDTGLRVSQSVRSISNCCELHEGNTELSISLLDQRQLAGSATLYSTLTTRLPKFFRAERRALSRHLAKLTHGRHAKFQETIYQLEPNVKEAPGGMRDLHVAEWLRKLNGFEAGDAAEIDQARRYLGAIRCFLHYQAGRDQNVLSFELQDELAAQPFLEKPDPAAIMREYFRHARAVHREALRALEKSESVDSGILSSFRDWKSRLSNSEISVIRERLYIRSPQQLATDPGLAMRLFQFVARHGIPLSMDAERRILEHFPRLREWYAEPRALWPELRDLLSLPHAGKALQAMLETGMMRAIFPEWENIDCLVVRDFYHRYTVDEHSLIAIHNVLYLRGNKEPGRQRFAQVLDETEDLPLLLFALLFHDAGKGGGEAGHVQESLRLAEGAMERIGMPAAERDVVRFLIEAHLELSQAMTARDLSDPATALSLAGRVGTIERLKLLTLLTYADVSAVHPGALTPWRGDQLWRVYSVTRQELTRELDSDRIETPQIAEFSDFLEGFPTRYLRTHTKEEIAGHAALARKSQEAGVALEITRRESNYRLDIASRDRKFLFASLAGALSSFGMNILKAEAFANRQGLILDTFTFSDPHRTLDLNPQEIDRLRVVLQRVTLGKLDVKELLRNRPRPAPPSRSSRINPAVRFDNDTSDASTLIEILAEDRPGLLYDVASLLSSEGCNIEVVLIDTEANKAIDVFYVTFGGGKLPAEMHGALRSKLLAACAG